MIKLNLGCGNHCPAGWVNIDSSPTARIVNLTFFPLIRLVLPSSVFKKLNLDSWPKGVVYMDISKSLPYGSSTVDYIYLSHVIEHLTEHEGRILLTECSRVLKENGVLRIITPDFNNLIDEYIRNRTQNPAHAVKIFMKHSLYFEIPYVGSLRHWLYLYIKRKNNHHFVYDEAALRKILMESGFHQLKRVSYLESMAPEVFADMDIEDRFKGSLAFEATR